MSVLYRYKGMHIPIPNSLLEKTLFLLVLLNLFSVVGSIINPGVCYSIGVLIHFLWLAVFSSKTSIYIVNKIPQMLKFRGHAQLKKTKSFLTLLLLFLPFPILIPSLIVDYVQQPMFCMAPIYVS